MISISILKFRTDSELPTMNDTTIHPHIDVKYLGVLIDTRLNFLSHMK